MNPPYDWTLGPADSRRTEQAFLGNTYPCLNPGSVLVFVIPGEKLTECSHILATNFRGVSAVGTGAAAEFPGFLRMFQELPNIDAILLNPLQEPVPVHAVAIYAVAYTLARCASDTNSDCICLCLKCLPTEFRMLCARDATLREAAIRCTAGYTKWAVENHHAIAW